jgi:integrase
MNISKVTSAIVWDHRGRVADGGKGQVEIRVTVCRKSYHFGTGVKCYKSELVAGQLVDCPGKDELNRKIGIIYNKVLALVNACVDAGEPINTEEIRRQVWQTVEAQSDEPVFMDWLAEQVPVLSVSDGTRKHYVPLLTRLEAFARMKRWQDVTVENIMGFDAYLHTITKPQSDAAVRRGQVAERLSDGGIYNYHKCLKALLNRAFKVGKIDLNPYDRLKGQFKRGEKLSTEYLTEEEMRRFERLLVPKGSVLEVVRDLFVFQMYTGLPYSDMQAFDIADYKWDGKAWQHIGERIKTGVPYVSQLLPPAVKVLERYDWKIPRLSNADYNRHLKSLGAMAGIATPLHSHLARHTFATYMLRNGAKIENVSRMLGHTNITQTQRYAKVLAESVHEDFDRVAEKMGTADIPQFTELERKKMGTGE